MHIQSHTMALHTFLPTDIVRQRIYTNARHVNGGAYYAGKTPRARAYRRKMRFVAVCLLLAAVTGLTLADPPISLNKDSFAETVGAGNPVFVKFFAPW